MMSREGRPRAARALALTLAFVTMLLAGGCAEVGRQADLLIRLAPRLIAPGGVHVGSAPGGQALAAPSADLPPPQTSDAFDWEAAGTDGQGRLLYHVRIRAGGSPYLVATAKLTPLFQVDGKNAPSYVGDAYFQANPGRTPFSMQPGDEFTVALPADTFVVRWQEERQESFGQPARLREYVSERGDRLRYYLSDPFPIRYELLPADGAGHGVVHFSPDLAFMLGTGQTDPLRLARLVYRVTDPDIFQVEAMRRLASSLRPGVESTLDVDRGHTYLDPVREALTYAIATEPVPEPERAHLTRAIFPPDGSAPFLDAEDALGAHTDLAELPDGQAFRIEYLWDGTVRVDYKTGPDDARGKRDPYLLRENERWTALYQRLAPKADNPIKWGPGEPADLDPFPTARDPSQRSRAPAAAYDYLLPGRVLTLTFRPVRFQSDLLAELEFRGLLREVRERYRDQIDEVAGLLERLQAGGAASGGACCGRGSASGSASAAPPAASPGG